MAAVLAGGRGGALLGRRAAGALWRIRASSALEIVQPRRARISGVSSIETPVAPDERTTHNGIPVTTVARTLLDLAAVLSRTQLERAIREAELQRLGDATSLAQLLERHRGRRGAARLRAALDECRFDAVTTSELEARFLELVAQAGLEPPLFNAPVRTRRRTYVCDVVWRRQRVIVELDGRASHERAATFESDRARDRALQIEGWRVVRITWRQLTRTPREVVRDLRLLLRDA